MHGILKLKEDCYSRCMKFCELHAKSVRVYTGSRWETKVNLEKS